MWKSLSSVTSGVTGALAQIGGEDFAELAQATQQLVGQQGGGPPRDVAGYAEEPEEEESFEGWDDPPPTAPTTARIPTKLPMASPSSGGPAVGTEMPIPVGDCSSAAASVCFST